MRCLLLAGLALSFGLASTPVLAQGFGFGFAAAQPWTQCRAAVRQAERGAAIPEHLLAAIARVESGRRDPRTGRATPWPWTINAEGQGFFFESKAEAIAAVRSLQARGVRSIDVGCMQVNLMHHPTAFASLEQAFDPPANAAYAARFLTRLHEQANDWSRAAALYHSATPELGAEYQRRVLAAWPEEKQNQARDPADTARTALASAWASTLGQASPPPSQRVAVTLPMGRGDNVRIIPLAEGAQGRGLDAYRAAPIAIASRLPRATGG